MEMRHKDIIRRLIMQTMSTYSTMDFVKIPFSNNDIILEHSTSQNNQRMKYNMMRDIFTVID